MLSDHDASSPLENGDARGLRFQFDCCAGGRLCFWTWVSLEESRPVIVHVEIDTELLHCMLLYGFGGRMWRKVKWKDDGIWFCRVPRAKDESTELWGLFNFVCLGLNSAEDMPNAGVCQPKRPSAFARPWSFVQNCGFTHLFIAPRQRGQPLKLVRSFNTLYSM